MPVKIFTIPFQNETEMFHDDVVERFCINKRIHKIETKFFCIHNQPYWTVAIIYGQLLPEPISVTSNSDPEKLLDTSQKALLLQLKTWRKTAAEEAGFPVYLVAQNAHLIAIVLNKCMTLEHLKLIRGFGKSKIEKYGKAIIATVKQFYANP